MIRAIYPGSFDPVTFGHLDIITRSSKIVDELIIGVLMNKAKTPLFSVEERVKMLKEVTKDLGNVKVVPFDGLLVEFARQQKARLVIRGLRAITDFEYEIQMSQTNHKLEPEVETMFLTTNLKYSYLYNRKRSRSFRRGYFPVRAGDCRQKYKRKDVTVGL